MSLNVSERAELEALRDLQARVAFIDDDGAPVLRPWLDAHRMHAIEPYIGCPFCRDRFVEKTSNEAAVELATAWREFVRYQERLPGGPGRLNLGSATFMQALTRLLAENDVRLWELP